MFHFDELRLDPGNGLEGRIWFSRFDREVDLMIRADSVEAIAEQQRNAVDEFLNWRPTLFASLELATFRYYQYCVEVFDRQHTVIESPSAIWPFINPSVVIIPEYRNATNTYVQIELNCVWEIEHGMEWSVRNSRDLYYVGAFEGNSFKSLEECGPAGFV